MQIVIPARNEETYVGSTLRMLRTATDGDCSMIVVDNGSEDCTRRVAIENGASLVIDEPRIGKGYAVCAGTTSCEFGTLFVCDADINGLTKDALDDAKSAFFESGAPMLRIAIDRPPALAPVTTLLARPLLKALGTKDVLEPLGGLFLVDRDYLLSLHLPGGWGFDVALTIETIKQIGTVPEIKIGGISHRERSISEYRHLAEDVAATIVRSNNLAKWDHSDCLLCSRK